MRTFLTLLVLLTNLSLSTTLRAQHAYTNLLPTTEDSEAAAVSSTSPTSTIPPNGVTDSASSSATTSASSSVTTCTDVNNRTFNSDEPGYSYCLTSQSHVPPSQARRLDRPTSAKSKASSEVLFKVGH